MCTLEHILSSNPEVIPTTLVQFKLYTVDPPLTIPIPNCENKKEKNSCLHIRWRKLCRVRFLSGLHGVYVALRKQYAMFFRDGCVRWVARCSCATLPLGASASYDANTAHWGFMATCQTALQHNKLTKILSTLFWKTKELERNEKYVKTGMKGCVTYRDTYILLPARH